MEELQEKSEGFNLEQVRPLMRRRRWHLLLPLFLGWLAVWAASWMLPATYRSGTLILVEQPTVPEQYVVSNITGNLQDRLQSITQQILSRTRLLRIIDSLNLYSKDRQRGTPDDVVEQMRKDIEIELVHAPGREQLTAFNVYYSSENPHVAQQVTSALTNLFISENLEVRQQQSEDTTQFLQSQLEDARTALAGQEEKIREFKDQHLGDLPGQVTSNLQILGGLQSQLQSEEDALNRAKQQNVYLESLLGQYRSVQRSSKSGDAPMGLPAIDQELERLRAQLADLSSHYTDRHPDVRKLKEQIAKTEKMKQQLTADLQTKAASPPAGGIVAQSDADIQDTAPMAEMQSQLKANQIEITNRQHAIEELKTRIADYQGRLNRSPVREQELTDLTRGYDQSRANYDALLKKKNDSELATSLELRQQGEHFRILDPPSLPVKPYSPNRMKLCGIGLFVGLVLGVVISVGAEKMDDRLYSEKDLKTLVPAAVISEIPGIITPGEENHQQRKLRLGWAATGLLLATIAVGCVFSFLRG